MNADLFKDILLPLALIFVLFGMGMTLTPGDFKRVFISPKAKLVGLFCQILALPTIAFGLAVAFALPGELAVGLMVLAACPGGPTSNVISHLARGDTALSVTLTAVSSMVAVFTIPLIVGLSMQFFLGTDTHIQLPFLKTLAQLSVVTILPILLGMTVKRFAPVFAVRMEKPTNLLSLLLLATVIAGAILREKDLPTQIQLAGPAAILLNLMTMGFGYLAAWRFALPQKQRVTISIEAGIQNGTLALAISLGLLESQTIAIPAVVYSLFMFVSGGAMILLFGTGKRSPKSPR